MSRSSRSPTSTTRTGSSPAQTAPASSPARPAHRLDAAALRQDPRRRSTSWLAKYRAPRRATSRRLAPAVRRTCSPYADAAAQDEQQAKTAQRRKARRPARSRGRGSAAALMNAIAQTGQSFPMLLTQVPHPFVAQRQGEQSIRAESRGWSDTLKTFTPETVSDAGALHLGLRQRDRRAELVDVRELRSSPPKPRAEQQAVTTRPRARSTSSCRVARRCRRMTSLASAGGWAARRSGPGSISATCHLLPPRGRGEPVGVPVAVVVAPQAVRRQDEHRRRGARRSPAADIDYALAQTGTGDRRRPAALLRRATQPPTTPRSVVRSPLRTHGRVAREVLVARAGRSEDPASSRGSANGDRVQLSDAVRAEPARREHRLACERSSVNPTIAVVRQRDRGRRPER